MKQSKLSAVVGSDPPFIGLGLVALAALAIIGAGSSAAEIRVASAILTVSEAVRVPAPQAGVLRELRVREGTRVSEGDALGEVDAREQAFQSEVIRQDLAVAWRESESDVRVRLAEKEHRVAEAEWQRATSVNADLPNTVSAKEVDRLRLAFERTELEIEHAAFERELLAARMKRIEADLRLAEHRVDRMRIVSPIAGFVSEVNRRAGEWVDDGEPIVRVVRVDRLRAEGYLSITDAVLGLIGRPVTVTTRLPGGETVEASGRITFVSPEAEPVDSKVRFWAEIDNASLALRPGLTASVVIHDDSATATADARGGKP